MNSKNSTLFMAYYLLAQVADVIVTENKTVLLTFGKSPHEYAAQLIPTIHGLTLFFTVGFSINLNLNSNLYHDLVDDNLMACYDYSRLGFLDAVLLNGLENHYSLYDADEVLMQLVAS